MIPDRGPHLSPFLPRPSVMGKFEGQLVFLTAGLHGCPEWQGPAPQQEKLDVEIWLGEAGPGEPWPGTHCLRGGKGSAVKVMLLDRRGDLVPGKGDSCPGSRSSERP